MIVSPSLLAADKLHIPEEAMKMKNAGATYIHVDIMDAVFVPAYTWNESVVRDLKENTSGLVLDVHLMIVEPEKHIKKYIDAGADVLTVHYEAFADEALLIKTLQDISKAGVKPGLAFKPATSPYALRNVLPYCEQVIVMSVEPGKGGQPFVESQLDAIAILKTLIKETSSTAKIEVDGGINDKTGRFCKDFGADILVAGSYLFGHDDYQERVKGLLSL